LIYYADTEAFYEKYKEEIWRRLSDMADDMGEPSILHLIVTFNGSKEVESETQLRNLLAWWAAEEVCRGICADWEDDERQQELDDEISVQDGLMLKLHSLITINCRSFLDTLGWRAWHLCWSRSPFPESLSALGIYSVK
jgi:hypothetical protein